MCRTYLWKIYTILLRNTEKKIEIKRNVTFPRWEARLLPVSRFPNWIYNLKTTFLLLQFVGP